MKQYKPRRTIETFHRQRRNNKNKNKMSSLKKYLNSFVWYDLPNEKLLEITPKTVLREDYPSSFELYCGNIPKVFLNITGKILPVSKFKLFQKYLQSQGFQLIDCGSSTFKYGHFDRKILITGDATDDTPVDEDEDDDDDDEYERFSTKETETMFITLLPTEDNKKFIEKVIKKINTYLLEVSTQIDKFYMIAQNQQGLFTQKTKFKAIPIKNDRFDLFYGKKFPLDKMKEFIEKDTDKLMLLHGDPGTGKSNFIKHLITNSKRKVIYIAPSMLSIISSPGFITFMMENRGSLLLIEDAEEVLSTDRNSATNNLLGITSGFLEDALDLKVICTFNCDVAQIDEALMRKGRMFLEYKFDKLSVDDCRALADFMGNEREVVEPMTLAEFFNVEPNHIEDSFERRTIGFV